MRKLLPILALVSLLFVGMLPSGQGGLLFYPYEETVVKGSISSGTFPDDIYYSDDNRIVYQPLEDPPGSYYIVVHMEDFTTTDGIVQLQVEGYVQSYHCGINVWNGSGWNERVIIQEDTVDSWYNYTLTSQELRVGPKIRFGEIDLDYFVWYLHLDVVRMELITDTIGELEDRVEDLEDELDDLKKELERLKKQTGPDVTVNQTELPTIPHTTRGNLDDDVQSIDPYRTTTYTVNAEGTGTSVALYLPYPTSADETTCIRDDLWIGGTYTRLWVNDTVGASELLNTTSTYTYFNLEYCYNATVESTGGSIIVNRIVDVRLIDSFDWGYNTDSGIFGHRSATENDIAYNMENVRIYWAFPTEDNDNRDVFVDMSSVVVKDADNNLVLDRGRHYEVNEGGGVSLEVRWVNTSGTTESRTYHIQFTRASYVESESFYTVYDNDITISDTYGNAPFTTNVHHTQPGTANFEGKIIIKFSLTGRYAGEKIDVRSLIIKRSDTSLAQQYTYDSISNELRIVDQTVDAGESITYTLYFDWYDEKSAVYELILGDPLILYSLLLLAGVAGFLHIALATKEETRKRIVGAVIIIVDVAILIIILVVG